MTAVGTILAAEAGSATESESQHYSEEAEEEQGHIDVTNAHPALQPDLTAPAESLHS